MYIQYTSSYIYILFAMELLLLFFIHVICMPLYGMTMEREMRVVGKKEELWMWKDAGDMTSLRR